MKTKNKVMIMLWEREKEIFFLCNIYGVVILRVDVMYTHININIGEREWLIWESLSLAISISILKKRVQVY